MIHWFSKKINLNFREQPGISGFLRGSYKSFCNSVYVALCCPQPVAL